MSMKAQSSTEYLVILVIILLVALIVIGILLRLTSNSTQAHVSQDKAYWRSQYPISVEEAVVQNSTTTP